MQNSLVPKSPASIWDWLYIADGLPCRRRRNVGYGGHGICNHYARHDGEEWDENEGGQQHGLYHSGNKESTLTSIPFLRLLLGVTFHETFAQSAEFGRDFLLNFFA
ncbi:MAG: hypothetical protein NVS9B4_06610 [Candidatus Acidiferrum sp.]